MSARIVPFSAPMQAEAVEQPKTVVILDPLPSQAKLYEMHGPACPPGKCKMVFVEFNSYGRMVKCTKCGAEDFTD